MQTDPLTDDNVQETLADPLGGLCVSFDHDPRTRVVFGAGTLSRLGELSKSLSATRVLLVTDQGLAAAGHEQRALDSLKVAGLPVVVFNDVKPNPTTDDVARGLTAAKNFEVDFIIGLGGGSSLDCAKGVNFLLSNGGEMADYWGIGKATKPMLPSIAVPTTAGTGSEAQSFALIANAKTHMKMACGDKKAACAVAILDPDLTATMPRSVAAATAIDALSHAVETYVTKPRNTISQLYSRRAWQLISQGFPQVMESSSNTTARAAMLLGANFAGTAIENSMLGATHALVNPLTAHYGITHGVAIGIMLPHVIRYNSAVVGKLYGQLAQDVNLCAADDPEASEQLAQFVQELVALAGSPTNLQTFHVKTSLLPTLAEEAAKQWTGTFNPRPVNAVTLQELYQCALQTD